MLASQRQQRTFIVPGMAVARLAVTLRMLSDDQLQLIQVVGQVSEKLNEPDVLRWLTPYLAICSERMGRMQELLSAIVEEQPDPKEPEHG